MSTARIYLLNPEATAAQIKDALLERIQMLEAMVSVSQCDEFMENTHEHIANYLWVKTRLLFEIRELLTLFLKPYA